MGKEYPSRLVYAAKLSDGLVLIIIHAAIKKHYFMVCESELQKWRKEK